MANPNNLYMQEFLAELGGARSIDIVGILRRRKEVDEFKLASLLKMDVKAIRKILYRLYEKKLVSFRKRRDDEKGWYIYIWKLVPNKLDQMMGERRTDAVNELRHRLEYEKNNQFFKCNNGCLRVTFDKAFEMAFVCPECNGKLEFFDNTAVVNQLKKYVSQVDGVIGG